MVTGCESCGGSGCGGCGRDNRQALPPAWEVFDPVTGEVVAVVDDRAAAERGSRPGDGSDQPALFPAESQGVLFG